MLNLLKMELKSSRFKWANIILILLSVFKVLIVYVSKNFEQDYYFEIYMGALAFIFFYLGDNQMDITNIIINSIPVSKKNIVMSTYIVVLLGFILSLIYTALYLWVLKVLGFSHSDVLSLKNIIISFSIFLIHTSILLPIYHYLTFIWFIVIEGIGFYIGRSIVNNNSGAIRKLFLGNNVMIFFIIAIGIMIVSILISSYFYKKREFVRR